MSELLAIGPRSGNDAIDLSKAPPPMNTLYQRREVPLPPQSHGGAHAPDASIAAIFVYGTLQRGECREPCWPRKPLCVEPAVARGRLHDLGPYPGLVEGQDLIRGELWRLAPDDVPETLRVLDQVEGATGGDDAWYQRRVIPCRTDDGACHRAYSYYFARPETIAGMPIVAPGADGCCHWRSGK